MLHIAVLDDDKPQLTYISNCLKDILKDEPCEIRTYQSMDSFWMEEQLDKIDLLLLDIELGNSNGIQEAEKLKQSYPYICIIFISAYIKYAPMVYDVEHIYFVLKEQIQLRLPKAIEAALAYMKERKNSSLTIKWKNRLILIAQRDILYIERRRRKCSIITTKQEYDTYVPLSEIEASLHNEYFIRVHYSYIVHMDYVQLYARDHVVLKDGTEIPVSRSYEKKVKEMILKKLDGSFV